MKKIVIMFICLSFLFIGCSKEPLNEIHGEIIKVEYHKKGGEAFLSRTAYPLTILYFKNGEVFSYRNEPLPNIVLNKPCILVYKTDYNLHVNYVHLKYK